ncbi:uncharacterized protein V1516DRAFT_693970 [Lipomyces oligophaga]|uniref:uncharacterized protein n=1 Tax=Lipomyces oligophaga TaxID=45792 RepID=UPI0034CF341F
MPPLDYCGKYILAPMVRSGELPTRLLSLKYGADIVWSPEIVDKKIIGCTRVINSLHNCVEFWKEQANNKPSTLVFKKHLEHERSKIVFQLGTSSPELAVEAARVVAADVDGIDVNSGCPKHFSIHSGMGAALLRTPDKLVLILEELVANIGKKYDIGISVKIRLLDTPEETFVLVQRLVKTGISALTVHCRKVPMRPRESPIPELYLAKIADICHEAGVICIANGGMKYRSDLPRMRDTYGVDSIMIAEAAESNMSCFAAAHRPEDLVPWKSLAEEYILQAAQVGNIFSNTKYLLAQIIPGKAKEYQQVVRCRSYEEVIKRKVEQSNDRLQAKQLRTKLEVEIPVSVAI